MNPLEQHNDLPLAVRKRLDYFPQLLARLVGSPIWDTYEILDEALTHYKAGEDDLSQGQKFIARLKHYLEPTPMDAERREQIENWAFSTQRKEEQILNNFEMPEWKAVVTEADRATLENRLHFFGTTVRRIDQRDKDLDSGGANAANTERHIAQIEKRLAELNAAPAPLDTSQSSSPTPNKGYPHPSDPLDTPAFTVIKSQAQVLSEMIAQIATDAEASANAKGFTLVGKPGNPVPPPPPQPLDTPAALVSEWNGLLCQPEKFGLTQLLDAFRKVGLLSDNGEPTEWGRTCKGAWAGALDALTTPPALLTVNALAAGRCLAGWGIIVSPNTLRNNTSAEADNTRKVMNRALAGLRR